jgi:GNAT superfamily N-acetyltransferase
MAAAAEATTTVGLLTAADLDDVLAVQRSAYVEDLLEGKATFAAMLLACPTGCFALRSGGRLRAYFFTHPGSSQMLPPALDSTTEHHGADSEAPADLYYLHDLAVHADARTLGAGTRLLHRAVGAARAGGFDRVALTAVQEAQHYWARFGFSVVAPATLDAGARARLTTYATRPVVMIASLADVVAALAPRAAALGLDLPALAAA